MAEEGGDGVGDFGADVDEGAAVLVLLEVGECGEGAVDEAEVIGV